VILLRSPALITGQTRCLNDAPLIPTYANVYDYQDYAEMVGYSTAYPAELLRPYRWLSTEGNDALTTEDGDIIAVQSDADTTPYRNRLYVHVDQLNRLSFYRTRAAALAGANDVTREDIDQSAFTLDPTASDRTALGQRMEAGGLLTKLEP
jgi:hypothetical protein